MRLLINFFSVCIVQKHVMYVHVYYIYIGFNTPLHQKAVRAVVERAKRNRSGVVLYFLTPDNRQ